MNLKHYQKQVRLLLDVLPFIDKEACFALKGGTAINLFVRDLPRLSVDIDLAYVGDEPRAEALKLTAALDRQHPRDLFDVSLLLENEGLNRKIIMGFVCYLLSHRRPIHEILSPTPKNQRALLNTEFDGMTDVPFDYEDFERTRDAMISIWSIENI